MSLHLASLSVFDLLVLAQAMSAEERAQFQTATGMEWDPESVARICAGYRGIEYLVVDGAGVQVSAFGCFEISAGVFQTWMVSRHDAFDLHGARLTRIVRRVLRDLLKVDSIRRIQTMARADRAEACRWYVEGLGMQAEGVKRAFYPDGSNAAEFAAVKEG